MTKMLLRNARANDLNAIHALAEKSGIGMTTLPKDISLLEKRLQWSIDSFGKTVQLPGHQYYLFVLEDADLGHLVGTSAIEASIGQDVPFYSYKLIKRTKVCPSLNIRTDYEVLNLVNDNQGHSELCTLFLDPTYRYGHHGLLLSRSRFLFMGTFPERFSSTLIADMRGVSDDKGHSPFWDHVGYHFFKMSYAEADRLTLLTDKQFIADLMPRHPIYVELLAREAQAVIGKPHPSTVGAMNILSREGFRFNNYVDIFDAGPTLEAPRDHIKTITTSRVFTLKSILNEIESSHFLLANLNIDYRATLGPAIFDEKENTCMINQNTAELLQMTCGDRVRIAPLQVTESIINEKDKHEYQTTTK